jgi:hypothetical protein
MIHADVSLEQLNLFSDWLAWGNGDTTTAVTQ